MLEAKPRQGQKRNNTAEGVGYQPPLAVRLRMPPGQKEAREKNEKKSELSKMGEVPANPVTILTVSGKSTSG